MDLWFSGMGKPNSALACGNELWGVTNGKLLNLASLLQSRCHLW
ncbi:hypothetical protein RRG08_036146, partial [Elysia crispata]